jgi:phosphoglycolate phosphatase
MPQDATARTAQQLALFDIDGTLMKGTGPQHRLALENGIHHELQLRATTEGIDTAGQLDYDLIRLMVEKLKPEPMDQTQMSRIMERCEDLYLATCAPDLRRFVLPGVVRLLEDLQEAGVVMGVVTGNLQAIGWKKLELAGLRGFFQTGAFSQDGGTRGELAALATQRAEALAPGTKFQTITLIGDHRNDVLAAKQNGYRSVAVGTGVLTVQQLLEEGADLAVADMTELTPQRLFS